MKNNVVLIKINTEFIKLEQFLKLSGAVSTGGQAKILITGGSVLVNGEVCLQRGKKLYGGEEIILTDNNKKLIVTT